MLGFKHGDSSVVVWGSIKLDAKAFLKMIFLKPEKWKKFLGMKLDILTLIRIIMLFVFKYV